METPNQSRIVVAEHFGYHPVSDADTDTDAPDMVCCPKGGFQSSLAEMCQDSTRELCPQLVADPYKLCTVFV